MNIASATLFALVRVSQMGGVHAPGADLPAPVSGVTPVVVLPIAEESPATLPLGGPPEFEMSWFTIDGGGATYLSGDNFDLGSTIGQPDTRHLSGGLNAEFTFSGGFWAPEQELGCAADANGDGRTDAADLSVLLGGFGNPAAPPGSGADFNVSGLVEVGDLSVLLANFGCGI